MALNDKLSEQNERAAKEKAAELAKARLETAASTRQADELRAKGEAVAADGKAKLAAAVAAAGEKAKEAAAAAAGKNYTVKAGDTLSAIAQANLGSAARWNEIYELNKALIGSNPDAIKAGMVLILPK
jgi:nucleoid-associated protein YgaU